MRGRAFIEELCAAPGQRPGYCFTMNNRLGWHELPAAVRSGVEAILGSPVVSARSQSGGYSPGSADRVLTEAGGRFFVKAVGSEPNPDSPGLHRREARVMALLPGHLPVPKLAGVYDDGGWVAVVLEDVEGRHPRLSGTELHRVLDAVDTIAAARLPAAALAALPSLPDEVRSVFEGWKRLRGAPSADLDAWAAAHHAELESLAAGAADALRGDHLVHVDLRADNVLVTGDGGAVMVDWPWAARGASWFDALTVLIDARVSDPGCDTEAALRQHRAFAGAAAEHIDAVLAALAGYFTDSARAPAPPGIPTLREFQRAEGAACLAWLRERRGSRPGSGVAVLGNPPAGVR